MGRDLARAEAELDRKKTRVSELKSELSKLEAEVTDLESAVRVFRRLLGDEDGTAGLTDEENYSDTSNESVAVGVGPHDLSGWSIRDCAVTILKESEPQWIPYQEIMRRAIERGYTSARGSNLETIRNSFCSILNRYQNVFERKGNEYRLKQDGD